MPPDTDTPEPDPGAPEAADVSQQGGAAREPAKLPADGGPSGQPALTAFAAQAREAAAVVVENVFGKPITLRDVVLGPASGADLEEEFGGLPHVAIEARVALSESEAHLSTLLAPLAAVSQLRGEALDGESVDEDALQGQIEGPGKELVDLLSVMLMADSPIPGEITLSAVRVNGIDESVGMISDVSGGAPLHRLDQDVTVGDADPVRLTLILPAPLLTGLAAALGSGAESRAEENVNEPDSAAASDESGLGDSGGAFGSGPGEDDLFAGVSIPVTPVEFPEIGALTSVGVHPDLKPLELILDVSMRVSAELGRSTMTVQEILALGPGSVVELDKLAGEPVDILINDRMIALGEVVMVDENFGVRVTEILSPQDVDDAA